MVTTKTIIAHRHMRNFAKFDDLKEWLSRYHLFEFYEPHVKMCWTAMQEHKLIDREHDLDYKLVIQKMKKNKLRLNIYRKTREIKEIENVQDSGS
jgi:hypothetical protein